jgi:hypothetical protein
MRLGLDFHGVLDTNPDLFMKIAKAIINDGGEVFIITGLELNDELITTLKKLGNGEKWYTNIYSITSDLEKKYKSTFDAKGGKHFDNLLWDKAKADFCRNKKIDIHIDDTERYAKFFSTPIMIYHNKGDKK